MLIITKNAIFVKNYIYKQKTTCMKTKIIVDIIALKKQQLEAELKRYPMPLPPMIQDAEADFYIARYTEIAAKIELTEELLNTNAVLEERGE